MSIKYKVIEKGQPGVVGGGSKKFYASTVKSGEKDLNEITKDVERISTVSGADIRATLYALVDVAKSALADGQVVRLGELGSLRVSIHSEGMDTADKVTAKAIKKSSLVFTPTKEMKKHLAQMEYQKG